LIGDGKNLKRNMIRAEEKPEEQSEMVVARNT
jgi:hypothetical protein